jgi:hypothetical protein
MKKILFIAAILSLAIISCDKVKNAYPPDIYTGGLDPNLYPGDINNYVPPTFSPNTNTDRNVLIEDFTGHKCTFCPAAAALAHTLEGNNPGRVFISTIHSGPDGSSSAVFQSTSAPDYIYDFTNFIGLQLGAYFGDIPGSGFSGNPCGNISRVVDPGTGKVSLSPQGWTQLTDQIINANDLKVNLQAVVNYFPSTSGAFIHIEVDPIQTVSNDLRLIVALYEDSIVKPQKMSDNSTNYTYVHRDILKAHINGEMDGVKITDEYLNANGKYYYDYSLAIPADQTADNSHLLIYVVDSQTKEIYQVIKKKFN